MPKRIPPRTRALPLTANNSHLTDPRPPNRTPPPPLHTLKPLHYRQTHSLQILHTHASSLTRSPPIPRRPPATKTNFLLISNLNDNITATFLHRIFPSTLPVRNITILTINNRSQGLASVQLPSVADPSHYVKRLHRTPLCGQPLDVQPDHRARLFAARARSLKNPKPPAPKPSPKVPSPPPTNPSPHPPPVLPSFPAILISNAPPNADHARLLRHFRLFHPMHAFEQGPREWVVTFDNLRDRRRALQQASAFLDAVHVQYLPITKTMPSPWNAADPTPSRADLRRKRDVGPRNDDEPIHPRESWPQRPSHHPQDPHRPAIPSTTRGMPSHPEPRTKLPEPRPEPDVPVHSKPDVVHPGNESRPDGKAGLPDATVEPTGNDEPFTEDDVEEAAFQMAVRAIVDHIVVRSVMRHRGTLTKHFEATLKRLDHAAKLEAEQNLARKRKAQEMERTGACKSHAPLRTANRDAADREEGNPRHGKDGVPPVTSAHTDLDDYFKRVGGEKSLLDGPQRKRVGAVVRSREGGKLLQTGEDDAESELHVMQPRKKARKSRFSDVVSNVSIEQSKTEMKAASAMDANVDDTPRARVLRSDSSGKSAQDRDSTLAKDSEADSKMDSEDDHITIPSPETAAKQLKKRLKPPRFSSTRQASSSKTGSCTGSESDLLPQKRDIEALDDEDFIAVSRESKKRRIRKGPKSGAGSSETAVTLGDTEIKQTDDSTAECGVDGKDENGFNSDFEDDTVSARTAGYRSCDWRMKKKGQSPREYIQQNVDVLYSSRDNRQRNRMFRKGISLINLKHDVLTVNQLKQRKKAVQYRKSRIHGMGLFACETIEPGEFIIEYIGEIVRGVVADIREARYGRRGMGDSYLFRLPNGSVVDATHRGCIARFINHSCDPNITAKNISVDGQLKIVFYSKKRIAVDEELTYDYKFEYEEDEKKIKCLCDAVNCRRFLN